MEIDLVKMEEFDLIVKAHVNRNAAMFVIDLFRFRTFKTCIYQSVLVILKTEYREKTFSVLTNFSKTCLIKRFDWITKKFENLAPNSNIISLTIETITAFSHISCKFIFTSIYQEDGFEKRRKKSKYSGCC